MVDSRAVKRATAGAHKRVIVCSLQALLFFLLTLMSQLSYAQEKYALNDPRNPDCPCHKYQKMADDAYRQLQNEEQSKNPDQNFVQQHSNKNERNAFVQAPAQINTAINAGADQSSHKVNAANNSRPDKVKISQGTPGIRNKKKKPGTWIKKRIHRSRLKHSRIKKQRPDYSVCYKW